jgi:hypothetical protein
MCLIYEGWLDGKCMCCRTPYEEVIRILDNNKIEYKIIKNQSNLERIIKCNLNNSNYILEIVLPNDSNNSNYCTINFFKDSEEVNNSINYKYSKTNSKIFKDKCEFENYVKQDIVC